MKTSELTGAALDWAVAMCEGVEAHIVDGELVWRDELRYSTDWAKGGPIIEREGIAIDRMIGPTWAAYFPPYNAVDRKLDEKPLIAAMRCYVASKLGESVNIPQELTA